MDTIDEIKMFAIPAVVFICAIWLIAYCGYKIDNVPVTVYKGDKVIYSGVSACVRVTSSGDTTSVKIKQGAYCLFPKAYYVGRDIRMEGSK